MSEIINHNPIDLPITTITYKTKQYVDVDELTVDMCDAF